MNASLIAFLAAMAVAVIALVWALMERRRAAAAEARNWELRERHAETEARMKLFEDQAATSTELLRAQARESASTVAEELLKRTRDIRISEAHHGPPDARRYEFEPTYSFRNIARLNIEFDVA